MSKKPKKKPGPPGDSLKLEGDWKDAITTALHKERPANGWPDRPVKTRAKRRKTK